jgi:hypothetical protein
MTNNTEQRRAFEDGYLGPLCRERYADTGKYRDGAVERDWILFQVGWQAALAQRENTAKPLEQDGSGDKFALKAATLVDDLLKQAGYSIDSSARGALSHVISHLKTSSAAPTPSLCTAEEAADLLKGIEREEWFTTASVTLSLKELSLIINADRAKR